MLQLSNSCYDYHLKLIQKDLKKGGLNFCCDDAPDWEKMSFDTKNKGKCTVQSLKYA